MFRQLKEMFRKEEEPSLTLASVEVPGWLAGEYSKVEKNEKDHVNLSRKNILGNIDKLRELVGLLGSAEHEGVVHPKLGNVVEKSLPLFKKAIISALNRQYRKTLMIFITLLPNVSRGVLKVRQDPDGTLWEFFPRR